MITHTVCFRWKPETSPEHLAAIEAALATLPAAIAEVRSYSFGSDAGAGTGNYDFAVVATFDSLADWRVYDTHPEHERVRAELIRPVIAERAAVQFGS